MNERIEKMWVDGTGCSVPRKGKFASVGAVHIKKFAELILTEVISTIYRSDIGDRKQERLVDELAYKFGMKS